MKADKTTSVLFLCARNSCRSQMAKGFAWQMGTGVIEAHSAGTNPVGIYPRGVQVMREAGIDLSPYSSRSVEAIDHDRIELVVTL